MDRNPADLTLAAATRLDPRFLAQMDSYAEALERWRQIWGIMDIPMGHPGPARSAANEHAETQANDLLCSRLSPVDAAMWRQTGRLMRPSRLWPGMEYLIQRGGPVKVVERGDVKQCLCVVVAKGEPESDRIMTILDLIESDERRLWEMAVATPGHSDRERWPGLIVPNDSEPPYSWHDRLAPLAVFAIGGVIGGTIFLAWAILFG